MLDFPEEERLVRDAVRSWCQQRLEPEVDRLDRGEVLPYPLMRDFAKTFGIGEMMAGVATRERSADAPEKRGGAFSGRIGRTFAVVMLEFSRYSPGFALAFGGTLGLFAGAVLARGTREQRAKWVVPVAHLEKIGCWGLTEPEAGSDAFGSMKTRAVRDGAGYRLSGSKTFITNAPHADVFVIYARVAGDGGERVAAFLVDRSDPGVSTGPSMRKMGMHASPTGEIFLDDVRLGADRLLGGEEAAASRADAKSSLTAERFAMVPMALGIVERSLEESVRYAKARTQWGRPIAEFQLVQEKLAKMYVAQQNLRALVLRQLEAEAAGTPLSPSEASAAKLYATRAATDCALEAVQVMGGAGYMAGSVVEMLARDAKLLQIGGGTDEIQITHIAKALLA